MCENGKMRSVLFQEWREGVNSTMIHCKKFCKCHNIPQYNNKKKSSKFKGKLKTDFLDA
jgi:hypothetical protein